MLRIGHGFDVHRLARGRPLILGGVRIASEFGLLGHSDADVLAHAVMDSLLGALSLGDIGAWFPDSDPAYKGADSMALLARIISDHRLQGWSVVNLDTSLVLERPKIAPHLPQMRRNFAEALHVAESAVSIKATTSEGLGFAGRGEGAAAWAVALLAKVQ